KRWSAEQADLLPSDDGRRALSQTVQVSKSLRRGVPGFVLALKNRADQLAPSRIILQCGSLSLGPLAEVRRVRIERLDAGGICKKVRKEPGGMRDLGKGQTLRFHRGLSWHRWTVECWTDEIISGQHLFSFYRWRRS